jgi:glyoxylase-like metal-dependent hydrolase (beta-lactamase superfamily II)
VARRQEQEDAREEVTEVAPGVARMELPIRMPGLGHVNCYALIDDQGAAIVDPGLPGQATWKALQERLGQVGLTTKDVHTVVITHSHPDHFGGAARFAKESDAKVVAHRTFGHGMWVEAPNQPEVSVEDLEAQRAAVAAEAGEGEQAGDEPGSPHEHRHSHSVANPHAHPSSFSRRYTRGYKTPWGGQPPRPPFWMRMRRRLAPFSNSGMMIPKVTHPVEHGDVLMLAGREFHVHHTPGHTMDHFCLHDPEGGVFISGDHVLPTITPHISGLSPGSDPLKLFFYALDRVGEIAGVKDVLPAHGHPFDDLHDRAEAIKRHHRERLERIREISREIGRAATVEEFSQKLFKQRSWGPMADAETYAHLEHMRLLGSAECFREGDYLKYNL